MLHGKIVATMGGLSMTELVIVTGALVQVPQPLSHHQHFCWNFGKTERNQN